MSRAAKFLLFALFASLLVHALLLYFLPPFEWPDFSGNEITAELVPVKPTEKEFKPIAPPRPKPAPRPRPAPAPAKAIVAKPASSPAPASAPVAESAVLAASAPVAKSASTAKSASSAPKETVPMHAKLVFDVYKGKSGLLVGRAVHEWALSEDGHYSIKNTIEATGIFSLFYSQKMVQTSVGTVTENGLRPDLYTIVRGDAEHSQQARFDWKNMTLSLEGNGDSRQVPLDPSTQDQLSFIYEFAYSHPEGGVFHFLGTDGRKVDTYDYAILGEETLNVGNKKIKTLHLKKMHSSEGTDLWLSIDHYYWPAKIMITDKNGDSMEQVIREIE